MDHQNEILRKLTSAEYIKLIEIYENKKTPYATRGLNFLLTQKKLLDKIEECGIGIIKSDRDINTFYTHKNGNVENGTFIAISGTNDYFIFLCSLQESKEEIRECIFNTHLIEWSLGPLFLSTEEKDALNLLEFVEMKNYEVTFAYWNVIEHQSKEKALEATYNIPEDVYLAPLKFEDSDVMNLEWPHRYNGSLEFIQDCVVLNGGLGVYSKDKNKLLCWVVKNENGSPGMLQTLEEAKRKGYAALVMKAFCTNLAKDENIDIVAYVKVDNEASQSLFKRLEYDIIGKCCFIKMKSFSK